MNDPATEKDRGDDGENRPLSNADDVVPSVHDGEDLQHVLEELFPAGDQDETLQPILRDLAARIEEGEDLTDIRTLLLSVRRRWSGPLPPPDLLAQFEAVLQGLANRIVSMWERQQAHRIRMESSALGIDRKIVIADIIQTYLGTILGFIFAMAFLAVGAWLITKGHRWVGLPIGLLPPGVIFSLFAYQFGPWSKRRQREQNDEDAKGVSSDDS